MLCGLMRGVGDAGQGSAGEDGAGQGSAGEGGAGSWQLAAGSGAQAGMQEQLAACLANTGAIAALKTKMKAMGEALATKTRQLHDSEQANIALHGVQLDKLKADAKLKEKNTEIKGLKLELATLRRKASTYANGILGAWPVACTLLSLLASRASYVVMLVWP